ncbi:branched-chain amino acid ABC transporter permease [Acidocella sp. KAb 2-4]|uniref:branched-chain amino acid ABC transporter permease n=1 Tax=Acidocella sp. KAb 2-4 TaxID=2885158 RepID=UPI001D07958B|nr:branched-chain amino acid ABC transporter permease [Acidocella sp. KAb 2-4]MCB5944737.1 branched-chain amino acid ABC transporter permease [Acidocella sp. KAb 2-4]
MHSSPKLQLALQLLGLAVCAGAAIAAAAMPWWSARYTEQWTIEFLYTLALAQGWNLLAGYGGLLSVGQQAFIGVGGYLIVAIAVMGGLNPFVVVPIAGVACTVLAIPMAALLFRLRGPNFAVGTWVVAEVLRLVISNIDAVGGGSGTSITDALIGIPVWWRMSTTLWIALALGAGGTLIVYALLRSRLGLALTAVRDSEAAAASLGVSVTRVKWIVYLAAACWAGMTGALIFITKLRVAPDAAFSIDWMSTTFFVVVIGGIGTIEGPIIGTLVFFVLRGLLADYGSWYLVALGVIAIVFVLFIPKGVAGLLQDLTGASMFPVQRRAPR